MDELNQQLESIGADAHVNEWRIFGPPGTGKTTHLSRQIKRAVEKYGADSVLVTSFSRAAAAELVGRDLPIARERIGTLHAHCYRALGRPPIAETKVSDWNEQYPGWAVNGATDNDMDEPAMEGPEPGATGDELLAEVSRLRNRKVPLDLWLPRHRQFYRKWCEWKDSNGLLDFTDLLERAYHDCPIAPGNPRVIFCDEAQDFTRLQLDLVRRWGSHADFYVVVGDDDQTIYSFTGATPDAFLKPDLPSEHKIVLSQSWRLPQAVYQVAQQWIGNVSRREPKEYRPTAEPGEFRWYYQHKDLTYTRPGTVLDEAEREIAAGRTVMLLTSCAYMLATIRARLIERGIPFHNPYRRRRADWNPLYATRGTSAADRVLAFLKPHHSRGDASRAWTIAEFRMWAEWVRSENTFQHGVKTRLKALHDESQVTLENLLEWLQPAAYESLMRGIMHKPLPAYLDWWVRRVRQTHARTAAYPARVALRRGVEALTERPQVIIGTIHSVKGGEADVVYLFPDLSRAADAQWRGPRAHRDTIIRQFYVGMTRARRTLAICAPAGAYRVEFYRSHATTAA